MNAPVASLDQILGDPRWFADGFDPPSGTLGFIEASRADIAMQPFLDARWNRTGNRQGRAHLHGVTAVLDKTPVPRNLRFIWHTGFCCSTLLAKALDAPERNLSLCEPKLLVDVADAKRAGAFTLHADLAKLPQTALKLLSRSFSVDEVVTVKPAPAANHLLPEAVALPGARHLFLYSSCESFIIAIARLGASGMDYARAMLGVMQRDGIAPAGIGDKTESLSRYKIAALVWRMQVAELCNSAGPQTRALDCDLLLSDPKSVLAAVDGFFSLGLGEAHVARVTGGSLFQRNAKNPAENFDSNRRRNEYAAARKRFGTEIEEAVAWSREALGGTLHDGPPSEPLMAFDEDHS